MRIPHIAITAGEPAGIGPDLCVMLAHQALPAKVTIIADQHLLAARARQLNQTINIVPYSSTHLHAHQGNGSLCVWHTPVAHDVTAGTLNSKNSQHVLNILDIAIQGCQNQLFDAMVTTPVHKGVINDAHIPFTGHTEYLAEKTNTSQVVMMLIGGGMRVALVTIHIPLSQVSAAITPTHLRNVINILHEDMVRLFGIAHPKIMITGLNPHAGEGGYLGTEEIKVINPVLMQLRQEGMDLIGPLPADTAFSANNLKEADAFLAMYHDQGLTVLKYASFGEGVNLTLGLPIIRTSVDHGTALDIAGSGHANHGSLISAIQLAITLAQRKQS